MLRTVHILAFDGMEVLDYAGPYEVFNVAGELTDPCEFRVASIGVTPQPAGRGGLRILPDYLLDDAPPSDILVIPGGAGTRQLSADPRVVAWIAARASTSELLLTICTGALLAGAAGLLDGREATTHHGAFEELAQIAPLCTVVQGRRYVRTSERIRTSAGVSAGIDLALAVVEELVGPEVRALAEAEMEWMWPDGPQD